MALLSTSRLWTSREKLVGFLVVPLLPYLLIGIGLMLGRLQTSATLCSTLTGPDGTTSDCPPETGSSLPLELVVFGAAGLLLAVPFVVGLVLLRRARLRAAL